MTRFKEFIKEKRISKTACFFAGVLGALPYFYEPFFIFTFISLIVLFYNVISRRNKEEKIFSSFFFYFLGLYTPLYFFLSELYPYERFGFTTVQAIFVVICSCIFIPLLHTVVESAILSISRFIFNKNAAIVIYPALWVIGEWVLTLGKLAFPWGNISVSLTGFLPYLQTISILGKYFITFLTVLVCVLFAYAIVNRVKIHAYIASILLIINTLLGTILYFIPIQKGDEVKVASVQGNALSNEKWNADLKDDIFETYVSLTEEAAKKGARLIVLPESAFPHVFYENGIIHSALSDISKMYDATIVSGVRYYRNRNEWNSCVAILPDGSISEKYHKRHLVPFGEFIPFADTLGRLIPFVAEFNETSATFIQGTYAVNITTEVGNIAPLVCFDSIFTQFAFQGVEKGAEYIAIVTNDSWFNDSAGIYTHLRHAQIRAIENRRYVLRAANTGVSAFIDEKGRIFEATKPLTEDVIYASVYPIASLPFYHTVGDLILYLSFVLVLVFIIKEKIKKCRR